MDRTETGYRVVWHGRIVVGVVHGADKIPWHWVESRLSARVHLHTAEVADALLLCFAVVGANPVDIRDTREDADLEMDEETQGVGATRDAAAADAATVKVVDEVDAAAEVGVHGIGR